MPNQWYAQIMGEVVGPMSGGQLKQMAAQKRISPDDQVKKGESGNWTSADRVKGLFGATIERSKQPIHPSSLVAAEVAERNLSEEPVKKPSRLTSCPDCNHQVSLQAATCPHCGRQLKEEIHYEHRSRGLAVALAWLVGMTGAHRFYMRESQGWLYLIASLSIMGAPFVALSSIVDGFRYLNAEDEYFQIAPRGTSRAAPHRRPMFGGLRNFGWLLGGCMLFVPIVVMTAIIFDPDPSRKTQPASRTRSHSSSTKPKDNWKNSSIDTHGMPEKKRIELFHKFIYIEDRYPGDKPAQRPYKQELYDEYGIDEAYEIKLLGEAIDSKWPLPPE